MRNILAIIILMLMLAAPALALTGTDTITINGTNVSTAQTNCTVTGTTDACYVTGWTPGTGIKTFIITVTNTSDTHSFVISNITIGQVVTQTINSSIYGINQSNITGAISFTYTQPTGNATYTIQPAPNNIGTNFTNSWCNICYIMGGSILPSVVVNALNGQTLPNLTVGNLTVIKVTVTNFNATNVAGNVSQAFGYDAYNLTNKSAVQTVVYQGTGATVTQNATGYIVSADPLVPAYYNYTSSPGVVTGASDSVVAMGRIDVRLPSLPSTLYVTAVGTVSGNNQNLQMTVACGNVYGTSAIVTNPASGTSTAGATFEISDSTVDGFGFTNCTLFAGGIGGGSAPTISAYINSIYILWTK